MNLKKFAHFLAVVDMKNFSRAADAVHLSPPALTRSLQTLEEELGIPLFDRRNGIVTPSQYSAPLVGKIRTLLSDAFSVEEAIERIKGLEEGEIRIGFGPFAAAATLSPVISKVIKKHPKIKININLSNPGTLLELLVQDQLDIVVADSRYVLDKEDFHIRALPVQQVAFIASTHNPLAHRKDRIELHELNGHSIGVPDIPDNVSKVFKKAGIEDFPKVLCDDMRVLIELVKETPLIAIVPRSIAEDYIAKGELLALPIELTDEHYAGPCIITRVNRILGPACNLVIKLIGEHLDKT